jgi:hypothetical protein
MNGGRLGPFGVQGRWHDLSGRLVYLQIDKHTKRERMMVPGEKVEADVIIGERVVALRPANESMMKGAAR